VKVISQRAGLVAKAGTIAHGRGEAFDYLIGETTLDCVKEDIYAAAALLLQASYPVISVNGNTAVLAANELIALASAIPAKLEVNVFYGRTQEREKKIAAYLQEHGANEILGIDPKAKVPNLHSARGFVDQDGIAKADLVLVPLEDGDRTKALIDWGKKVISIDLNPLSRTAREATLNICDHVTRALNHLANCVYEIKDNPKKQLELINNYSNKKSIKLILETITKRLTQLA
jgi:4-phosphopantoate---beta-alanine ligase